MPDERTYDDGLQLVGWREADHTTDPSSGEHTELPGIYHIGALVDGVYVELTQVKAGYLSNSTAVAQKAAAASGDKKKNGE